jgi:thiosulfate dehydrogenase [quinone] large subunit
MNKSHRIIMLMMGYIRLEIIWGFLRIGLGWIFFWSFIDKLFGLGFSTAPEKAWVAGGSPTSGFLKFGTKGPFSEFYQSLAGNPVVDYIFMAGCLFAGLALMLGIGVRIAGSVGLLMMILIYTASFLPPQNNPLIDNHIIYAILCLGFALTKSGHRLGLGKRWSETGLVKKYPFLK